MHFSIEHVNIIYSEMRKAEQEILARTGRMVALNVRHALALIGKPEGLLTVIAESLGMQMEDYQVVSRKEGYVDLRRLGAHFLRINYPHLSLQEIGRMFGQDHTTIINALNTADVMMKNEEPEFMKKYNIALQATISFFSNE